MKYLHKSSVDYTSFVLLLHSPERQKTVIVKRFSGTRKSEKKLFRYVENLAKICHETGKKEVFILVFSRILSIFRQFSAKRVRFSALLQAKGRVNWQHRPLLFNTVELSAQIVLFRAEIQDLFFDCACLLFAAAFQR